MSKGDEGEKWGALEEEISLNARLAEAERGRHELRLQLAIEKKLCANLLHELSRASGQSVPAHLQSEGNVPVEKQVLQLVEALKHREEAQQLKVARALDAFNLLASSLTSRKAQKAQVHDQEFEIFRLRARIIRQHQTIQRLIGWCTALQATLPFKSAARKARRYFKHWITRYKSNEPKPLPLPLERLKEDAEMRREKSWQRHLRLEAAEKILRSLLHELEHESLLPGNELKSLYQLAGVPVPEPGETGRDRLISRDFSQGTAPVVSVIIPLHDQLDYTLGCLRSICEVEEKTPFEIILVDDFSSEPIFQRINRLKHVRVVRNERNLGFAASCNAGAAIANGQYLVFLNNDTTVTPGWLDALRHTFETHPQAGIAGSKLLYADGTLQEAGGIIWKDGTGWNYGRNDDAEKPEYNYLRETDYVSGASLMIPRDLFDQVGAFDLIYSPAYYEDTDLAFKVRQAGKKVYYQPASEIIHFEGASNGIDPAGGVKKYQQVNLGKFREKWAGVLEAEHFATGQQVFYARDRSRRKKLVAVIDQRIPRPDQDAGSRSTFDYVRLFCDLDFNVKFIADDFDAEEPYKSRLEKLGVEVLHGNWYQVHMHAWLKDNAGKIDIIFVNRAHVAKKYLKTFRAIPKTRILYYGHDLGSVRYRRLYDLTGSSEALESSRLAANQENCISEACHAIYHPSATETAQILASHPQANARTIPLFILQPNAIRYRRNLANRHDLIFVGGFAHPPNVDAVLWFMEKCWLEIAGALPKVRLRIVGSHPTAEIERCAGDRVLVSGWVSDEELANRYWESRLAIIPLRYGAGVKGKVVEALHHHLPVVMTSVAAEGLPGTEDFCAIADDPREFAQQIIQLYSAPERLIAMADQGGAYASEHFSQAAALRAISADLGNH